MKSRSVILMVVAVGCGLAAAYMTSQVFTNKGNVEEKPKIKILVAKKNIPYGTLIKDPNEWFVDKEVAEGEQPKKAVKSVDIAKLADKRVNKPFNEEQWISEDDVSDKTQEGLPGVMQKGMRAMTIGVDTKSGVSGFVLPQSHVDIILVYKGNDNESFSKTILQDMLVLASDMNLMKAEDRQAMPASTVTIQVTPEQAELLTLAQESGTLKLVLRTWGDTERPVTKGVRQSRFKTSGKEEEAGVEDKDVADAIGRINALKAPKVPVIPKSKEDPKKDKDAEVAAAKPVDPPPPLPPPLPTFTMLLMNGDKFKQVAFIGDQKTGIITEVTPLRGDPEQPIRATPPQGPLVTPPTVPVIKKP